MNQKYMVLYQNKNLKAKALKILICSFLESQDIYRFLFLKLIIFHTFNIKIEEFTEIVHLLSQYRFSI